MKKRIVITGMGALASTGSNLTQIWEALNSQTTGIRDIDLWDVDGWEFKKAAALKDYQPKTMLTNRKLLKLISRQDVVGIHAAKQAVDDSGIIEYRDSLTNVDEFNDRTGVYIASPGVKYNQQYDLMPVLAKAKGDTQVFGKVLFDEVHPMWLLKILSNNVLAYVGIEHQFKGPNQNIPNHGVSGTQAIIEACNAIQDGQMDRAIVVGYESAVEPQAQAYYAGIGVLDKTSVRPFNEDRQGTVLAEAGAAMIIETLESAKARGANIQAEILGGSCVSEAMGILPVSQQGQGLFESMNNTLQKTQTDPAAIGMISAHGNGTLRSDASEANAIKKLFGINKVPVTGFKWSLGHTLAAAGVIETLLSVKALQNAQVPGIGTLSKVAKDCEGINVSATSQSLNQKAALVLTRGFSSLQGSLLIKAFE